MLKMNEDVRNGRHIDLDLKNLNIKNKKVILFIEVIVQVFCLA